MVKAMKHHVIMSVNGKQVEALVEGRLLLSDFLRDNLELYGTHVGCEHGVCGACTVQLDGEPIRSCLTFAVQVQGREIGTIESLAEAGKLSILQQAFHEKHGLQCGFCTPGLLMTLDYVLRRRPDIDLRDENQIREVISGNLCRCTGYQNIIAAVRQAAEQMDQREPVSRPAASSRPDASSP
jgi:aerobic-type carbon monoxide dehydrogenase small subunit (CoxS/CutS family)